ncbi:hypothetical protein [Streptomyces sp. NBC_00658]|uniref:hypothetical protein n=1 Tax=Streptomyces sp. NBC_00658 TaxID=2975800 RepID=UPI00324EE52F
MTRPELAAACASVASGEAFDARFRVFVGLGLLQRPRGKAYEGRYVFNPTSGAALLVFERLAEAGGVEEIMTMLGRLTACSRAAGRSQLAAKLRPGAICPSTPGMLLRHPSKSWWASVTTIVPSVLLSHAQRLVEAVAAISRD